MVKDNVVVEKSMCFAIRIVGLYNLLCSQCREYVISRQILRSGTSIGANVKEAQCAQTKKDFVSKMYIAFKESSETEYWLELLHRTKFISEELFQELWSLNRELYNILSGITKTAKED